MPRNSIKILLISFIVMAIWQLMMYHSSTLLDLHLKEFSENYRIYSIELPDELEFAGEAVPLKNEDVAERLDREMLVNVYWQSNTLLAIKRASRWFPVIEPLLKENGIPDDFKYIALIESNFQNVTSPSGAQGFWQFLEETGKKYGLEINEDVDERYHVIKATEAAIKYFKEAYNYFNNWTLTAASYNMGIGGINNQIKKQKVNSFYDLYLNIETSRYIFRILAAKEIYQNPQKYGFNLLEKHLYKPYKTYEIETDTTISDLVDFALQHKITYRQLKLLNPWLRTSELTNKERKIYKISLPLPYENDEVIEKEQDHVVSDENVINEPKDSIVVIHRVGRKESIEKIALNYHVDVSQIIKWNNLSVNKLKKGQEIIIVIKK